jgi:hypothetical protein
MIAAEAIDALAAAGVRLDANVRTEVDLGDWLGAFIDTIALADEQQVVLPAGLAQSVRDLFDRLHLRPDSELRARVHETLLRVEQRVAVSSAL